MWEISLICKAYQKHGVIVVCVAPDNLISDRLFYYSFYWFYYPLLGITFNVFYRIDREGQISSIAHLSFVYLYLLPDVGRMNDGNM